ncbi:MAG: hypothetical protein GF334_05190 [Candidatus Altiarchaeales archaeon]|nr:hypothetical protein [Candidatus Altiarchaeales archaeon]
MNLKCILQEQRRQMEEYKWLRSEEAGVDLGETALLDWVYRFAADFRTWAESIPIECISCGECMTGETGLECMHPFNRRRLELTDNLYKPKSDT